jgi:hypothetical protein
MESKIADAERHTGYRFHRMRAVMGCRYVLMAAVEKTNPVTYEALCALAAVFETRQISVRYTEDSYCGPSSVGSSCDIVIHDPRFIDDIENL